MRCPYCLQEVKKHTRDARRGTHRCPSCNTLIPKVLLRESEHLQATVGVVGFSGHGKTVYLTSLFSVLKKFSEFWPDYYYSALDEYTRRIIYQHVPIFEQGGLPDSTPANFPNPAMVEYHAIPVFGNAFVGFYDTAGEVFTNGKQIERAGTFVAHSDVALLIISIPDCDPERRDDEMSRLLDTYVRAAEDRLNANIGQDQRLVVIFTKSDLLLGQMDPELKDWLRGGADAWYMSEMHDKLTMLSVISINIEEWLRDSLGCHRFTNMARDRFREVRYTIVSALGAEGPSGSGTPAPLRVLDPFIWILLFSRNKLTDVPLPNLWRRLLSWARIRRAAPSLPPSTPQSNL